MRLQARGPRQLARFSGQSMHRQCAIEIARCIYKCHPFRKGKRRRNTCRFHNVPSYRSRAYTCGSRVEPCPRSFASSINLIAALLHFSLLSFFFSSISIPGNRYHPIDRITNCSIERVDNFLLDNKYFNTRRGDY